MKWLNGYSDEATDQLIALQGNYRTDSIVLAFEEGLQKKASRAGKAQLTSEEIAVLAIEAFEREINNGGFSAFFMNSSKEYAPVIVDALNQIRCPEVARLVKTALELLKIEGQATVADIDRAIANGGLEKHYPELNRLDERYYALGQDLSVPLLDFIVSNRCRIVL